MSTPDEPKRPRPPTGFHRPAVCRRCANLDHVYANAPAGRVFWGRKFVQCLAGGFIPPDSPAQGPGLLAPHWCAYYEEIHP